MSGWLWLLLGLILTAATLYVVYLSDKRSMEEFREKHGRYPCEVHEVCEPYIAGQTKLPCTCPKKEEEPEDWPPIDWYGYP